MIKIFRRFRRKLLSGNRTVKYLLYAIGEIILVVIGILIALQVNNWNESKRERNTEVKLLVELREDLIKTKEDLLTDIEKSKKILGITDSIYMKIIDSRKNNKDIELRISISYLTEAPMVFPKLSAYNSIQAYGVNIISNDSLRKSITDLFELQMERIKFAESALYRLNQSEIDPYFKRISRADNECQTCLSLKDQYKTIEATRQNVFVFRNPDEEFLHMLKQKFNITKALKDRYGTLDNQIDKMVEIINDEIRQ